MRKICYLIIYSFILMVCPVSKTQAHIISISPHLLSCSEMYFDVFFTPNAGSQTEVSFGDGFDTVYLATSGHFSGTYIYHLSGTYTQKAVLINNGIRIDSAYSFITYRKCEDMYIGEYNDVNSNCIFDATDSFIRTPNKIEVDSAGNPIDTILATSGFYYPAYGSTGTIYTFKVIHTAIGYIETCPVGGTISDTVVPNGCVQKYFSFTCNGPTIIYDFSVNPIVPVTGIHDQWGNIYIQNASCYSVPATVTLYFSPKYVYVGGAYPTPNSQSGNSISWNIGNLSANSVPFNIYYSVWQSSSGPLTIGDTVQSHYTVTPIAGDINPANNSYEITDTVRAGCDPNQMLVSPQGNILSGTQLTYNIEFMNTGNDTAFNIHVEDTLSDYLDIKSFKLLFVSAPMDILTTASSTGHNLIKFDFPNINLLDSSHHNACTAMLSFSINTKAGLPNGTVIPNMAGVYFDANAVVNTDTVYNTIGIPASVKSLSAANDVSLYPNPANGEVTIKTTKDAYASFEVFNNLGQIVLQGELQATETHLNISTLSPGMYYVMLKGANGMTVQKLEKW